jgi:5-(carboxyamino)imidazole ribonucleotide synthase
MGGGQLGRMFVHAAQALGFRTAVLDADPTSPAGRVAHVHIQTPYLDADGLALLVDEADAVTTEFENVPADALRQLATRRPVAPGGDAVAVCQDRAAEKAHFRASGVPCAPFAVIDSEADLAAADDLLPGILKTARLGYDGKGQVRVATPAELAAAWAQLGRVPCVLEKRCRWLPNARSSWRAAPTAPWCNCPAANLHRDGILAVTEVFEGKICLPERWPPRPVAAAQA